MKKYFFQFILLTVIFFCVNSSFVFADSYSSDLLAFIKGRIPAPKEEKPAVILHFPVGAQGNKIDETIAIPLYKAQFFENKLFSKGKFAEVIEFCNDVIKQYPDPFTYSRLARTYELMDKLDQAVEVYKKAIEIAPGEPLPFLYLWGIYKFDKNDDAQAKIYLDQYENAMLKVDQDYKNYVVMNSIFADGLGIFANSDKEGKPSQNAIKYLKMVLYLNPNAQNAYAGLGGIYRKRGETEEALKYLHKALELDPSDYRSHSELANIYKETGRMEQAKSELKAALRILNERGKGSEGVAKVVEEELQKLETASSLPSAKP